MYWYATQHEEAAGGTFDKTSSCAKGSTVQSLPADTNTRVAVASTLVRVAEICLISTRRFDSSAAKR